MNRHAFDPVSFLAGAVLAGVGIAILTDSLTLLEAHAGWLVPGFAVALGAAVLLSTPRSGKDASPNEPLEGDSIEDREAFGAPAPREAHVNEERL